MQEDAHALKKAVVERELDVSIDEFSKGNDALCQQLVRLEKVALRFGWTADPSDRPDRPVREDYIGRVGDQLERFSGSVQYMDELLNFLDQKV